MEMEDLSQFDENRPLLQNEDYEDYDSYNAPQEQESSFTSPDTNYRKTPVTSKTTTVMSREITRQKLANLYRHLGVDGDVGVNIDRFRTRRNDKLSFTILEFDKTGRDNWINLTNKRTGEFLKLSSLKNAFGGRVPMQNMLGLDQTPPELERSINSAKNLIESIPTDLEMQSMSTEQVVEQIPKIERMTREIAINTDLDMREMLGLDKALQRITGELQNNAAKLTEIDRQIEHEQGKLKEIEGPDYDNEPELRERLKKRIKNFKAEREARLEVLSHNKKELSSQFARIKQTMEKIADGDMTLREKIKLAFREHGITITAVLISLGLIIETIVTSVTRGGGGGSGKQPPKEHNKVVQWFKGKLHALARLLGRLADKASAALPGLIGSIINAILGFLKKAVSFAADHAMSALIAIGTFIAYAVYDLVTRKRR